MDFEKGMKDLEDIIAKLESNKVSMKEGIELFEKGAEIVKSANQSLKTSKGKLTKIKDEIEVDLK